MQSIETKYGTLSFENIAREFACAEGELAQVETTLTVVKTMAQQFQATPEQCLLLEQAIASVSSTKTLLHHAQREFARKEQPGATNAT